MILRSLRQRLSAATTRLLAALRRDRPTLIPANALTAALASLPEPSRSVYLLHARDQRSLSEIGERLELAPSDVERHLASALVHLDRHIRAILPTGEVAPGSADR